MIDILIPMEPKSQPRPRAANRGGFIHIYQPKTIAEWKGTVKMLVKEDLMKLGITGVPWPNDALRIEVYFGFTMPKSRWRKKLKRDAEFHTKKPDLDNTLKSLKDALNGVMWLDDSHVGEVLMRKIILPQEVPPAIRLIVTRMKETALQMDWIS